MLRPDGQYFLYSQTGDELGLEGPRSDPAPVKVRTKPLPPFIQYPLHGTEHKAMAVVFKWLSVEDVVLSEGIEQENWFVPPG